MDRALKSGLRKPEWIKVRLGQGEKCARMGEIVHERDLHTVCEEALCPNRGECWEHGRATIMILGGVCTRGCTFCGVESARPTPPDPGEPTRVADAVKAIGLTDVVITSVTRDDLDDGGADIWAKTIQAIRDTVPGVTIEALIPDFRGAPDALRCVIDAAPDVLGHNLEVVPSLYVAARPEADYKRSLKLLRNSHDAGMLTKTSLMLGLGETTDEILAVMADARDARCEIFYVGQYLQPTKRHLAVERYVLPEEFDMFRDRGLAMGFGVVVSGPLVRSSYHSQEQADYVRRRAQRRSSP